MDVADDFPSERDREWPLIRDRIKELLLPYQEHDDGQERDYHLVDDDAGLYRRRRIETLKPELVEPAVVKSLQTLLLKQYPNWEIVLAFGSSGAVVIRDDEIIDGLERQSLPKDFQAIAYEGSRPLGSRFGDIMYTGLTLASSPGLSVHIPDDSSLAKLMKK
jgi:hypothetical protein